MASMGDGLTAFQRSNIEHECIDVPNVEAAIAADAGVHVATRPQAGRGSLRGPLIRRIYDQSGPATPQTQITTTYACSLNERRWKCLTL